MLQETRGFRHPNITLGLLQQALLPWRPEAMPPTPPVPSDERQRDQLAPRPHSQVNLPGSAPARPESLAVRDSEYFEKPRRESSPTCRF